MDDDWVPRSIREREHVDEDVTLAEGIPEWLGPSLWHWLENWFLNLGSLGEMRQSVQQLERMLHRDLGSASITNEEERFWASEVNTGQLPAAVSRFFTVLASDDDLFLDALDQALNKMSVLPQQQYEAIGNRSDAPHALCRHWQRVEALQKALVEGGSVWGVMWPFPEPAYLARRVTAVSQEQVAAIARGHGRPGEYLLKAWRKLYGRHPDPSSGYKDAVRAVEAATKPVVTPAHKNATLGTIIPALEQGWKKFEVRLGGAQHDQKDRVLAVANMMRLMWTGEFDRHGTDDESVPLDVSQEHAEAAVHLALFLVEWFQGGAVRRV